MRAGEEFTGTLSRCCCFSSASCLALFLPAVTSSISTSSYKLEQLVCAAGIQKETFSVNFLMLIFHS